MHFSGFESKRKKVGRCRKYLRSGYVFECIVPSDMFSSIKNLLTSPQRLQSKTQIPEENPKIYTPQN